MAVSRRKFLGWIGGAAASTTIGSKAHAASNRHFPGYPDAQGVLHDITRCIGCRKCEAACHRVNELPAPARSFDDVSVLDTERRTDAGTFTVVNRYAGAGDRPPVFVKKQCNHCDEPACASACFVKALRKVGTGAVVYDASLCVGCRYCMIACPFNIPAYEYDEPLTPRIRKCHLCQPRLEKGLLPGCVEDCPKEALTFGSRASLLREARRRISVHPDRYVDHVYGEREMGGTGWLYLAGQPFGQLGMREDLGYEAAPRLTAGPLAAVPIVVGLWPVLLTGIYAISKRKEQMAEAQRSEAVAHAREQARAEMEAKLAALKEKMTQEKEAAINLEVKKALAEAVPAARPEEEK
ncbi:MAG: 4Fe-4S dicluster domain-containing protein [Desulfobacteraceae bacterium]|jgi:Fe-S-cluster-containing dehydrogenase component|nr:4Fe-4S dicluster domain-containing protein [Desulfobacteraceae bacterium]